MKYSLITVLFTVAFTTPFTANACQTTVMGGCIQEPTHDTSSHMKSQIANRVEHTTPLSTNSASTSTVAKIGAKKSNGNGNLIQTVNRAVVK